MTGRCRPARRTARPGPRLRACSRLDVTRSALALAAGCGLALAGCGGDEAACGPPAELATPGVTAAADGVTITYGDFTSSPNNDCPPGDGGPTSLTIEGLQREPATDGRFSLVLCLPRPDEIGPDPIALDDTELVVLSDVNARLDDACTLRLSYDTPPSGTLTVAGYCQDGLAEAGYAVSLEGEVAGVRRCTDDAGGQSETQVGITLGGTAAVEAVSF